MTKHQKEKQRYLVKWVLIVLICILALATIWSTNDNILVALAEIVALTGVFFGFNMATKVSDDKEG